MQVFHPLTINKHAARIADDFPGGKQDSQHFPIKLPLREVNICGINVPQVELFVWKNTLLTCRFARLKSEASDRGSSVIGESSAATAGWSPDSASSAAGTRVKRSIDSSWTGLQPPDSMSAAISFSVWVPRYVKWPCTGTGGTRSAPCRKATLAVTLPRDSTQGSTARKTERKKKMENVLALSPTAMDEHLVVCKRDMNCDDLATNSLHLLYNNALSLQENDQKIKVPIPTNLGKTLATLISRLSPLKSPFTIPEFTGSSQKHGVSSWET